MYGRGIKPRRLLRLFTGPIKQMPKDYKQKHGKTTKLWIRPLKNNNSNSVTTHTDVVNMELQLAYKVRFFNVVLVILDYIVDIVASGIVDIDIAVARIDIDIVVAGIVDIDHTRIVYL